MTRHAPYLIAAIIGGAHRRPTPIHFRFSGGRSRPYRRGRQCARAARGTRAMSDGPVSDPAAGRVHHRYSALRR